jgi:organic hydroperoxide reductase OsmC/OhrA
MKKKCLPALGVAVLLLAAHGSAQSPAAPDPAQANPGRKMMIMETLPHHYTVSATAGLEGDVALESGRLPPLVSERPAEFDGPGDRWSPETLVVGAVADCFVLTFRAIAKFSKLPWTTLTCVASGTVDRVDRFTQFTAVFVRASLAVPEGTNEEQAKRLLERAEQTCLITHSLKAPCQFEAFVSVAQPVRASAA